MFQYGVGGMYGRPVGGNIAVPSGPQKFGTIQDVSVEMTQKLAELRGQNKGPDDVAPGDMDIKGKASFGRIEIATYNALFFGDTITAATGKTVVQSEAASVPAPAGPYTVTVAGSATFLNDLGVSYAATGADLIQVQAGAEALGKYSVVETGGGKGVYTFNVADASTAMLFNYVKSSTNGSVLSVNNHLQGFGPIFELYLVMPYQNAGNGLHLFQCRSSKMSLPLKRDGHVISDFEFTSYPNAAGQWFEWFQIGA